jgi:hypothetical protein
MKFFINFVLDYFNLQLTRKNDNYAQRLELYKKLFHINSEAVEKNIGCIVFSFDRALQLDALLRSFFLNKTGECPVIVIYKASDENHHLAYQEVIARFQNDLVEFIEEKNSFKSTLLRALHQIGTGKIFFLVDDIIFTEKFDCDFLSEIDTSKVIFSLRMGNHLNYSFVVNKRQKLPSFTSKNDEYLYWDWECGELDWAYPLSVDGHIFNRYEIQCLAEHFDFKAPNSFEGAIQNTKELLSRRLGMSYKKARIVNIPCNKVQNEVDNLHGTFHQDELLNIWQKGQEIDIDPLQGYVNHSVHEEISFKFKERS